MPDLGVGSWPARRARRDPDGVAIVAGDQVLTYRELASTVAALAAGLRDHGIARGDRVAFLGSNSSAFVLTMFACGRIGAVFVPMNIRLTARELGHQVRDAGVTLLVHDVGRAGLAAAAAGGVALIEADGPEWKRLVVAAFVPDGVDGRAAAEPAIGPSDPAMIIYTSGTTGSPKGVLLSHGNVTWNALNVVLDLDLRADEVALIASPMFHSAALCMNTLPVLLKGGTVVVSPSARPEDMLRLIAAHGVTHLQGVPAIYQSLVDDPGWADADLSTVRRASSGAAAASAGLVAAFVTRGVPFSQGYGMTETAPGVCFLPARDCSAKAAYVGPPLFFTDVRLVDEAGADVPPGTPGEVLVSGPNVMAGYWGDPAATAGAFTTDGWYRSGDIAVADDDECVRIVGRTTDMYISGGENVYAAEVEAVLMSHPDIAECAVIAMPDERWGEVGRALLVPASGAHVDAAEVLTSMQGRLARYKLPKSVVVVEQLPRSSTGKVLKAQLRERYG